MSFDIVPGVHLVNVTRDSEEELNKPALRNKLQTVPVPAWLSSCLIQAETRNSSGLPSPQGFCQLPWFLSPLFAQHTVLFLDSDRDFSRLVFKTLGVDWVHGALAGGGDRTAREKVFAVYFVCVLQVELQQYDARSPDASLYHGTYFGSVILRISLQSRPINVTDSSTGGNFGMGIWVDWYMLCQSWIWKISFRAICSVTIAGFYFA